MADTWHDDSVLIAALVKLNNQISVYVLRMLDADAGRAEPVSPTEGHALGARLIELGTRLQTRASDTKNGAVIEPTNEPPIP